MGIRTGESQRFQIEWIQPSQGRIILPGWFYTDDADTIEQGTKTGDDWAIHDVPKRFWNIYKKWIEHFPETIGVVPYPTRKQWEGTTKKQGMKKDVLKKIDLTQWPSNALRDTFCTLHMSAYRSAERTALVLKHRNSQTLWQSYLGTLLPEDEAKAFFENCPQITPIETV